MSLRKSAQFLALFETQTHTILYVPYKVPPRCDPVLYIAYKAMCAACYLLSARDETMPVACCLLSVASKTMSAVCVLLSGERLCGHHSESASCGQGKRGLLWEPGRREGMPIKQRRQVLSPRQPSNPSGRGPSTGRVDDPAIHFSITFKQFLNMQFSITFGGIGAPCL